MTVNYQKFLDEAMLEVIKKVLLQVQNEGLQGDHSLYISFNTQDPLVRLSARMKQRYRREITVVLQHQFDNLIVESNNFSVGISFDGIHEHIKVPFRAITGFVDPSTKFSLQFKYPENIDLSDESAIQENFVNSGDNVNNVKESTDNVIVLDKFRNKKKL
ncbi:Stringent starvation protein B domain protein [Candidatus Trichorickettsia mobilis]|uniref:Stringent starvation protein B domain protein n=1 Tax=Candidatus Trichorickettsia mobilis TaxID=1346319 RepID=A0ABZ0UQS4_9RICK|nr:ClpXP protease specificity-enhancing factor SspB [Candidatus Trichorickettsia mobilis]WPY00394.1 Stringent starvation protein B domain protein [Candidatus Trichorickettsia mobilis]